MFSPSFILSRHTPYLKSKASLEGERRQLAVLAVPIGPAPGINAHPAPRGVSLCVGTGRAEGGSTCISIWTPLRRLSGSDPTLGWARGSPQGLPSSLSLLLNELGSWHPGLSPAPLTISTLPQIIRLRFLVKVPTKSTSAGRKLGGPVRTRHWGLRRGKRRWHRVAPSPSECPGYPRSPSMAPNPDPLACSS